MLRPSYNPVQTASAVTEQIKTDDVSEYYYYERSYLWQLLCFKHYFSLLMK